MAPDRSWRDNPRAGENGSRSQYIELSGKACKFKLTWLAPLARTECKFWAVKGQFFNTIESLVIEVNF